MRSAATIGIAKKTGSNGPATTPPMPYSASAEHFRQLTRDTAAAQSPAERIARALELGRVGLTIYASANGLTLAEARKALDARQRTQRRSRDSNPH